MRKKRVMSLLLALVLCLCLFPASALAADGDFVIEDGVLRSYHGSGGDVIIPEGVTQIGGESRGGWMIYYPFAHHRKDVTSVTIPNSVTKIGREAFSGCTNLTSVTIPSSVTEIDLAAFSDCTGLTSVTIPNSVTKIGRGAFSGCTSLTCATIGSGYIDSLAFRGCTGLTDVFMGNGVTRISDEVFSGCTKLTNVDMDNSNITYVGKDAFKDTPWLKNQKDFLVAGKFLFGYQGNGGAVTIPGGITKIGDRAFEGFTNGYGTGYEYITSVTIPYGVTEIGYEAFSFCESLTDVTIPDSVTGIGGKAFRGCKNLTSITIPGSVTSFGQYVFQGCSSLTSVTFESGVTEIGALDHLFEDCQSLTDVVIPTSMTKIGSSSFYNCKKLADIYYAGTQEQWRAIDIDHNFLYSSDFKRATIHYNSAGPCKAHSYDDGVVTTPATCTTKGVMTYTCVFCNETKTEPIDKLDHTPGDIISNGNGTHSTKCAACRQTVSVDACTYSAGVVTTPATCTTEGVMTYACVFCNETKTEPIDKLDHTPGDIISNGNGTHSTKCAVCRQTVSADVCTYGDGVVARQPTATEEGVMTYTCTVCNAVRAEPIPALPFIDVPADSWYANAVLWAVEKGITNGTGDNTFSPEKTCTHVEIVTFLYRAEGSPAASGTAPIEVQSWFADAVNWAYGAGFIDAGFDPAAECTRADTVTYMWKAAGSPAAEGGSFSDVPAGAAYTQAVAWAVDKGVTNGTGDGKFSPGDTCTRGQIVTFLSRAYGK